MRACLVAAVLVALTQSSAYAASIVYEHPYSLSAHLESDGIDYPTELRMNRYFPLLETDWTVPAFDPTLGDPLVLMLEITETARRATVAVDPPETEVFTVLQLFNVANGIPFRYSAHIFPVDIEPFHWVIQTHTDSFAFYDLRADVTFDLLLEGVASATYLYDPVATEIPEPTTLLLLGSGLLYARQHNRVCRRRRYGDLRHATAVFR